MPRRKKTSVRVTIPLNSERFELRDKKKEIIKTDNQLKSLQSVGQMIGEVLKELNTEKCTARET